ncbi:beta strand repeat-containing protein [Nonlabens agnitus]
MKTSVFNDENGDGFAQLGETISYSFEVTNSGATTLTNVTVTDPLLDGANGTLTGGPIATLAPGATDTTFSGSYTIQQSDIDAQSVSNQATATGTTPDGDDVSDLSDDNSNLEDDPTDTNLPEDSEISIIKTSVFNDENGDGFAQLGETISYSFEVTNSGATTLTNVTVTDPLLVAPSGSLTGGPIATLAPGAIDTTTFSGSYTIQQSDIDAQSVSNQATATGTTPDGDDVSDLSDDNSNLEDDPTDTNLPEDSEISIIKTSVFNDENGDGFAQLGETISYSFEVTNSGATTLTNVTVTDPLLVAPSGSLTGGPIASLAPGAVDTATFSGSYTIQQSDIDAQSVSNQATATGTTPDGDDVSDLSDDNSNLENDPTDTDLLKNGRISLIKIGVFNDENNDGVAQVGETISYSFVVTNTGNVTLTNVIIADPLLVTPNGSLTGGPIASLVPGESDSNTFVGTYTLSLTDVNASQVSNQATVEAQDPDNSNVTDLSDDNSNFENDPTITSYDAVDAINLIKRGTFNDENGDGSAQVGETVSYSFTIRNAGNRTITNIVLSDPLLQGINGTLTGGPITSLVPGAIDTTTFSGSYTIQQSDIDNLQVTNQAIVTGQDPDNNNVTDTSDDNSPIENDPTDTDLPEDSEISIIKTSVFNDENGDGFAQLGETISYSFEVTNSGATTLTNVTVTDPLLDGANGTLTGGPIATLAPGATDTTTFSGSYTIQQSDIDAQSVSNQATATGTTPDGDDVSDLSDDNSNLENDPTDTNLPEDSEISIIKTSVFNDENGDGFAQLGETISYSFEVTNSGATTLTNVTVTDPLLVAPSGSLTGGPIASLAPGAVDTTTFSGSYTIQQSDIDAQSVSNQATATGTTPDGDDVSDLSDDNSNLEDDPTDTNLPEDSEISIIKTSVFNDENGDGFAQLGETISYSFEVTNSGATTLTNVTVTDPLLVAPSGSLTGGPIASLAPGAVDTATFSGSYTIQQSDIDAQSVSNQATATGTTPDGDDVSDLSDDNSNLENDPTDTNLPEDSEISIIKTSVFNDENGDGFAQLGETISYSFEVTNSGATTLTNVTVTDPLLDGANGTLTGGPIATLAPGATDTTTFSGSYTIQQSDIDAQSVSNQATATGTTPDGDDVSDLSDDNSNLENDPTDTDLPDDSDILLLKESTFNDENGDGFAQLGETISYSFTVTNTGATTLTDITITDPLLVAPNGSLTGGPIASLAPGAVDTTTFSGSYTIQQSDIDAGTVTNQALATGTNPDGDDVTDTSDDPNNPTDEDPDGDGDPDDQRIRTFQMTVTYRCLRRARSTMRTVTASHSWARRSATASL